MSEKLFLITLLLLFLCVWVGCRYAPSFEKSLVEDLGYDGPRLLEQAVAQVFPPKIPS